MGVEGSPTPQRRPLSRASNNGDDGLGARKRVFIPGYSGCISRMQETIAGTFAQNSRDSHYLVYHGCKPTMEAATLPSPDTFYHKSPNPRIKTNAANRSNFTFGDERDWGFETLNEMQFKVPTKIPPRHASIMPCGAATTKDELDRAYVNSLLKIGVAGVKRLELSIRTKIDQRTTGGPMALRKAFKFFDTDASGDIDPDEFYAAMHAFGLEFSEDQVLALFGYYDVDRDGALSYYEFIDKVLESGFGLDGPKPEPIMVQLGPLHADGKIVEMKTSMNQSDISESACREVFDKFDVNKSGEIDVRELQQLTRSMGLSMDRESINNAMFELDRNRNGSISFDEFWLWWKDAAVCAGRSSAAPRTGGSPSRSAPNNMKRPQSEQSARGLARPSSRGTNALLNDIKNSIINEMDKDKARPKSRGSSGNWMSMAGKRPSSSLSRGGNSRPSTRNTQRSTAGQDYCPPPLLSRPPKLHGLYSLRQNLPPRPHTAPDGQQPQCHIRFPGAPAVPTGVTSGYVL